MKVNKAGLPINVIIDLMNKLMREPVYLTIKYLYPKFYRIDDIESDQAWKFKKYTNIDPDVIIVSYSSLIILERCRTP